MEGDSLGQSSSSGAPVGNSGVAVGSVNDPQIVDKLIDELKSQGMFDQIRKDCISEVDTKPAYQNLRNKVEETVSKYLSRQTKNWKPSMNKTQLRNQLRRNIQESKHTEDGVERIVDQVVNPKIMSVIQPRVEAILCNYLGIDEIDDEDDDFQNGNMMQPPQSIPSERRPSGKEEKLSNISSEDIEMRSTGESEEDKPKKKVGSEVSSPGLGGDISPLTPERRTPKLDGDMSPLTPPAPPPPVDQGSPHTPPLPPEPTATPPEEMSPVSDTDFADISPPKDSPETPKETDFPSPPGASPPGPPPPGPPPPGPPPPGPPPLPSYMPAPPPPPSEEMHSFTPPPLPPMPPPVGRSPITSPINSSSDDMEKPSVARTMQVDRSSVSASDISDTELAASSDNAGGGLSDLEALEAERAKIREQLAKAKISDIEEGQAVSSEGEIHSSSESEKRKQKMETSPISSDDSSPGAPKDDHEEEKAKIRKSKDEDEGGDGGSGSGSKDSAKDHPDKVTKESEHKEDKKSSSGSSSSHKSSKHRHSSHHKHHHKDKDRRSSSSSSRHHDRRSSKSESSSSSEKTKNKEPIKEGTKDGKREKERKKSEKFGKIEEKINQAFTIKSDKFKSFDMFAPKPKPKPHLARSASSSTSSSITSPAPPVTPPTMSSKTPLAFGSKSEAKSKSSSKKEDKYSRDVKRQLLREKEARMEVIEPQRKVFPELPVSRCDGDKLKQHEDDYLTAKRNLERKRQELLHQKQIEKLKKKGIHVPDEPRRKSVDETKRYQDEKRTSKRSRARASSSESEEEVRRTPAEKERPPRPRRVAKKFDDSSDDNNVDDIEKKMAEIMGEPATTITNVVEPQRKKTREEIEAAKILKTDKDTKQLLGFDESDLKGGSTLLAEYLERTDLESIAISDAELKEMNDRIDVVDNDFLYLDECSSLFKGGAQKLAPLLKKLFRGNPKIVHPMPDWLETKLKRWNLQRHEVDLIFDVAKVRRKRSFITEAEYDAKFPDPSGPKVEKIEPEEPEAHKIEPEEPEVSKPAHKVEEEEDLPLKKLDSKKNEEFYGFDDVSSKKLELKFSDDVDLNGFTFGMLPSPAQSTPESPSVDTQDLMEVGMSKSLISHFKSVLGEEEDVQFNFPPSPESNDDCEMGNNADAQTLNDSSSNGRPKRQMFTTKPDAPSTAASKRPRRAVKY